VYLLLACLGGTLGKTDQKNVLLHEAVRTLLGFQESPNRYHKSQQTVPGVLSEQAPQYMMDLYEKFKNNRISKGHLSGNTVRSIHAEIGKEQAMEFQGMLSLSQTPNQNLVVFKSAKKSRLYFILFAKDRILHTNIYLNRRGTLCSLKNRNGGFDTKYAFSHYTFSYSVTHSKARY
jgi:hypothetical protein